jgi:predicted RNase H-like HicB family nuclease
MTEGDTRDEAIKNLDDAVASWLEVKRLDGDEIPPRI